VPTDPALLQDALARTPETHGPGLVGLVTEHGEPVFESSVGVTDLADGRPPPDLSRVTGYQRPEQLVAVATAQPDRNPPVVLCQNGIDLHAVLTSDTPFVAAALAGG
jgi:hypothetical protein